MNLLKNQIIRQVAGALIGSVIAFGIYVSYKEAAPRITALTQTFWNGAEDRPNARFSRGDIDMSGQQMARQISRNREISRHFAGKEQPGGLKIPFNKIAEKASQFEQTLTSEQEAQILGGEESDPYVDTSVNENDKVSIERKDVKASVLEEDEQKWEEDWNKMERVPLNGIDKTNNGDLPKTGIGMSFAVITALTATEGLRRKRKKNKRK